MLPPAASTSSSLRRLLLWHWHPLSIDDAFRNLSPQHTVTATPSAVQYSAASPRADSADSAPIRHERRPCSILVHCACCAPSPLPVHGPSQQTPDAYHVQTTPASTPSHPASSVRCTSGVLTGTDAHRPSRGRSHKVPQPFQFQSPPHFEVAQRVAERDIVRSLCDIETPAPLRSVGAWEKANHHHHHHTRIRVRTRRVVLSSPCTVWSMTL